MLQPPTVPATAYPSNPRHDGWDGGRKQWFLEEFAEHGIATRALEVVGKGLSGLYALRARDAVFAAAWDAARLLARERLFDTLIGQAFEGEVHVTIKDENETQRRRRNYRLGMGMLDRLAAFRPGPLATLFVRHFEEVCNLISIEAENVRWRDWLDRVDPLSKLDALRDLFPLPEESAENQPEFAVWDYRDNEPRTDMPPPPDFDGWQLGAFGDDYYERALTEEEARRHYARVFEDGFPPVPADVAKRARGLAAWAEYFGEGDPAQEESDDSPIEVKSLPGPSLRQQGRPSWPSPRGVAWPRPCAGSRVNAPLAALSDESPRHTP